MAWTFKIFPSIGIARLGNCPLDSSSDFYVGPEIPGSIIVPAIGYKDSQGRVRRQAARFRIFGWEDGLHGRNHGVLSPYHLDRRARQ